MKLKNLIVGIVLVFGLTGVAGAVPIQIGTGGSLNADITGGFIWGGNVDVLGTSLFELAPNETSGVIDFFKVTIPLAWAEGTIKATIELLSPEIATITNDGLFELAAFFVTSNGLVTWDNPDPIAYTYNGINGSLVLDLLDIATGWQCGTTFTIKGKITNLAENVSSPVPEPQTMLLFGIGLVGMAAAGRKKLGFRS